MLREDIVHDWSLYDEADARVNHDALRAFFCNASTREETDVSTRLSRHQPRGIVASDFQTFDFILVLDPRNFSRVCWLRNQLPPSSARIFLLENVHTSSSPPQEESGSLRSGESSREHVAPPNYEPLFVSLGVSLLAFLDTYTTWQRPEHPPFSRRYTPLRSRQLVVPVGIREPTERRIGDLKSRTGCEIHVDRVISDGKKEQDGKTTVVTLTARKEILKDAREVIVWELAGRI